jgi:uncharacterized protein (TIGR02145 family)
MIRSLRLKNHLVFIIIFLVFFSCSKDENPVKSELKVPEVSTIAITDITTNTAVCGGNMTSDGGSVIIERGVCWSDKHLPTIAYSRTVDSLGTDIYKSNITGLAPNTFYSVRAYATNSVGTSYGGEKCFYSASTTFSPRYGGTIMDIDGNIYHTDTIGNQIWMVENLKTTRYRNGDSISQTAGYDTWCAIGACCDYNNDVNNGSIYGKLYNWYAATDSRGLAPAGWHVPCDDEWNALVAYLEGENVAGGKLKESGTAHWTSPNTGATNETGFTALPGGYCNAGGLFTGLGTTGLWLSTDVVSVIDLYYLNIPTTTWICSKNYGYSVRCVKD